MTPPTKSKMPIKIPHFKHCYRDASSKHHEFIEADGELIHKIEDQDEFYKTFGFTIDMAKAGVLPDEFIWEEYIKDSVTKYTACLQMHIIEYLRKHSDTFTRKYGDQYEDWIAAHAEARTAKGELCFTCKAKSFCSKRRSD